MSRILFVVALVAVLVGISSAPVRADATTPFIEGPAFEVGQVSDGHGYILASESDDGPTFLVMVTSDTQQHYTILATAEKGVVPAALIGRPVLIKAEVAKKATIRGKPEGLQLKILAVTSTRKGATPAR